MAHKIVVTDGIVLAKRGVGEAHTTIALLTREAGLVWARATSARLAESKLRYGLEPFTTARYSMLRGRAEWKLVGVENISREILSAHAAARAAVGRAGKLTLRLVAGEEASPELFDTVARGLALLARAGEKSDTQPSPAATAGAVENLECMLVLRVLWHLGYVANVAPIEQFLSAELSLDLVRDVASVRPALIRTINESLAATGL